MQREKILKKITPETIKRYLRPIRDRFVIWVRNKHENELAFWKGVHQSKGGKFTNIHYKKRMLAMAEESSDDFLKGKIVADFGCGPRGSLAWISSPLLRIGIDVLADKYADEFTEDITSHGMIYVKSTEKVIPLPSDFVDTMFTLNAIDHVNNFDVICKEIIRVLKPGGEIIASFNLEEPATPNEPQQLNEKIIKENLLNYLNVRSYRITKKHPTKDQYYAFCEGNLSYQVGEEGFLWVRARKSEERVLSI